MENKNKRWLVVIGAVLLQICLGSIYTWSLFNAPLVEKFGWEKSSVVFTFSIAILMFAVATLISGKLQKKIGPRKVATIGGLLYGTGVLLTSFATTLPMIYITYGVIAGVGVGFAYVCPLATLVKWFPNNKGAITGVAVGAFGLGSLIFKPIIMTLLAKVGVSSTFLYLGIIYLVLCTIGAQLFSEPKTKATGTKVSTDSEFSIKEMIKTPAFYMLWVLFLVGCTPGLLVIGLAKDIGIDFVNLTPEVAAGAVGLIAIFNTIGRLGSGAASDKFGRINVIIGLFVVTTASISILIFLPLDAFLLFTSLGGIAIGYGGLLAVIPPLVGEFYGVNNLGTNYGIIFQAYGIAALLGPVIKGSLEFRETFIVSGIVSIVGLALAVIIKRPVKKTVSIKKTA